MSAISATGGSIEGWSFHLGEVVIGFRREPQNMSGYSCGEDLKRGWSISEMRS